MQRHHAGITRTVDHRRRARTLAGSIAFVLAGTALYAHNVHAAASTNWLARPAALPAGDYRWTVSVSGQRSAESLPRTFTVDASVTAFSQHVSTAAPQHPSDSHGSPTLASAAQSQAGTTAWTSLRASACAASNNWDAARRECVAVPGAAAVAARLSSLLS